MAKKKVVKKKTNKISLRPVILFAVVAFLFLAFCIVYKKQTMSLSSMTTQQTMFDFGNQTFKLNDQDVVFNNGSYESVDDTYDKHTATIVNQAINPAGTRAAAILVDSPGGSGTFFYLVGATIMEDKIIYSEPILLGDRIKITSVIVDDPQEYNNGMITVNLLNRPADAPMSTDPTEEVTSKYAFQENGNLIVILQ